MRKLATFFAALLFILGTASIASAEASGFGARALSMGGAYTAVSDDSAAAYWNPAGLVQLSAFSLTPTLGVRGEWRHARDFVDFYNESKQPILTPMDAGADLMVGLNLRGIGFNAMTSADFDVVQEQNQRRADGQGQIIGALTLAREFTPFFAVGTNIKLIKEERVHVVTDQNAPTDPTRNFVREVNATGVGLDLGAQFNLTRTIRAGAVIRNYGEDMKFRGNQRNYADQAVEEVEFTEDLPTRLAVGVAVAPPLTGMLAAVDIERDFDGGPLRYRIGLEKSLLGVVKMRAGASRVEDEEQTDLSLGVGFQVGPAMVDLAVIGDDSEGIEMAYLTTGIQW
jgi:hypothetical protein